MAVQLSVKLAPDAKLVRKGLEDLGAEIPKIARKDIYDMMLRVRKVMRTPGKRPRYPIQWDSDKQRRYVLAMLREQDNLPYRRTDALPNAWDIVRTPTGYRMENPLSAAVYVYGNFAGERQSSIHEGRHPVAQEIMDAEIDGLPPTIEEHITRYGRVKGF